MALRFHAFWQPTLIHSGKRLSETETHFVNSAPKGGGVDLAYRRIETEAPSIADLTFLGSVFDSVPTSVSIDPVHVTPDGNAIVVQRMALELVRRGFLRKSPNR